jgi:uncharacterized protein
LLFKRVSPSGKAVPSQGTIRGFESHHPLKMAGYLPCHFLIYPMKSLTLTLLPQSFAICQLPRKEAIPAWILDVEFWSITRTDDEISLVIPESMVQKGWVISQSWRCFKINGPLDFSLIGILASLSRVLAEAEISIFALSTYNTDYILVQSQYVQKAIRVLSAGGNKIDTG